MKPKLHTHTTNAGVQSDIMSCINEFECSSYFDAHLDRAQREQKLIVDNFQASLCLSLIQAITDFKWKQEYTPTEKRDSIDIYGSNDKLDVVIELDKHRADQVAKKFVSRSSLLIDKKIFYISLCYPGTPGMNSSECIKYFGYCKVLSERMDNEYAGFIIE